MTVFLEFLNDPDFFSKIGLRYFLPFNALYPHAKFQVDPMVGSIITLRHIHTDRRTDAAVSIGPTPLRGWSNNSHKLLLFRNGVT